jgi:pSer/pThr/pTyr-binding forkhead associated (FHA) protein
LSLASADEIAFLVVEKGEPFEKGHVLMLKGEETLIGRTWEGTEADIGFRSPYVSRRHALIKREGERFTLTSLPTSKHGVKVNGAEVERGSTVDLRHLDRVSLADGEAVFSFCRGIKPGDTLEFASPARGKGLAFKPERHEILADGLPLDIGGKPYELFALLYRERNRAVAEDDIRAAVWPERAADERGVPRVTEEEIPTLVFRLRKDLKGFGKYLRAIRGYGYILDWLEEWV